MSPSTTRAAEENKPVAESSKRVETDKMPSRWMRTRRIVSAAKGRIHLKMGRKSLSGSRLKSDKEAEQIEMDTTESRNCPMSRKRQRVKISEEK